MDDKFTPRQTQFSPPPRGSRDLSHMTASTAEKSTKISLFHKKGEDVHKLLNHKITTPQTTATIKEIFSPHFSARLKNSPKYHI